MKENKTPNKLQQRINLLLTALFLVVIFAMGIMTIVTDHEGIYKAGISKSRLIGYVGMPWEDASLIDQTVARIRSVDDYLGENVFMSTEMGYFNSTLQYALGKRLINTGASQMITLNSGHLYDLQGDVPLDSATEPIVDILDYVPEDVPFLFVYEHPTIYSDTQIPEGYDVLDYSEEIADEIMEKVSALGISALDSRKVLTATGLELSDYLMYTDQHWSTRAALEMTKAIAAKVTEMTGTDLQSEKLDISQFETHTYPKLFMGKYGQRIGPGNIDPDDITIYWPKYETNLSRYTNYLDEIIEKEGSFRDVAIRWEYLEPDPGKTWNIKAYCDYGLTENYDIFTNPDAADCTILLFKDSYSAPIGSFLSLVADKVYSVDMRRSDVPPETWIQQSNPDMVVVSFSAQMLRNDAAIFL